MCFMLLVTLIVLCRGYCEYHCTKNADCKFKQKGPERCSVCADSSDGKSKCLYPFPYMFQSGALQCKVVEPCNFDCSGDRGRCYSGSNVYIPFCSCYKRFYGSICQYEATASQKPLYYVTWLFKGFISVCDATKLKFAIGSKFNRDLKDTQLVLSTSHGYYLKRSGWSEVPGGCYFGTKHCTVLSLNIIFPYKIFSRTSKTRFITLKDTILGYYANFSIMAIDLGKIIYKKQYEIIVSYEKKVLKCVASINLRNCAPSSKTPTIFNRLTGIDFISELFYVTNGEKISTSVANEKCSESNVFTWKLWPFTGDEEMLEPLFMSYTKQAWQFNPYSLDIGVYKVLLKVQNVKSNANNFAYCYIKVKALPLIVRVDGGSERMINKKSGLTLSVARSTDPNMPPSQQQDLFVKWSCKRISPPTKFDPVCKSVVLNAATPYFISHDLLMDSAVYNFTVKVWSSLYTSCGHCDVKPKLSFVRIEVGNETSVSSISIQCVENCKDKVSPNESLFLKVTSDNMDVSLISRFEWTYSNVSVIGSSLETMKVEDMPSFMLLLKENTLASGTEYTITVRDYFEGTYAKYSFETDMLSYDEECKVEPLNGTKGLTEFDIVCPLKSDFTLIYEFYDKSHEDTTSSLLFNGRMLGTTSTGQLLNVHLTRGYVNVYIINSQGVYIKQEIIVQLSDLNNATETITELKNRLIYSLIPFGDDLGVVRISSLITDILPSKDETEFRFLLDALSKISIDTFARIKMLSSCLYIILRSFNTHIFNVNHIQLYLLVNTLDLVNRLTNGFRQSVLNRQSSQYTSTKVIKEIAQKDLQIFSFVIKCKSNKSVDLEHDEISLTEKTMLQHGSYIIENIIDNLKDVLTLIQYPGKPPVNISTDNSDMMVWAMTNDIKYPISRYLNKNYGIPVSLSIGLMNSLINKTYKGVDVSLQTAYIRDSQFMWYTSDIKSSLVSVSLATRKGDRDLTYIRYLQQPISINMVMDDNPMNFKFEGSTTQVDSSLHQNYLDIQVKVHRLDIKPRSRITIIFLYPPTNGSLRVSVMEEYRPDFDHMVKQSMVISKDSIEYPYDYHEYDEPRFLYMGIIPGKDVFVNESVSYIFEVNTTLCQYWVRSSWKSDGCLVRHVSRGKDVNCQCNHLSLFGIAVLVPPQQVDPFGDAKLFLTVLDNPLVVAIVATFLILYFVFCIYLWHMDKKDDLKKKVIVLEDNLPSDVYPYLLAVFTSSRLNAGTSANVGIRLIGSEAESRAHILTSSCRKVLQSGSDDWFLINCPEHLGNILHLHLWHDNSGWSPNWFCENIFVYDLNNHTETKFVVEQWLALCSMEKEKDFCYPEARVLRSDIEGISILKRKFLHNVVFGIRDGHRFLRVLYRHPRSLVTRVQRFSIIMVYIMVSMLGSIMFYKPEDETTEGVDDYQYSVGMKEFMISIQCLILSSLLTCIVLFIFKRSIKFNKYSIRKSSSSFRQSRKKETLYSNFVRYMTSMMKNQSLIPVQLPNTPQVVVISKIWYIFAWVGCIMIMLVCSYFVMLYGLKLGPVKSKKWLSSVLLTVGEDALITGPAKIVLFAISLSLAFQLIIDVNTYKISRNDLIYQRNQWTNYDIQMIFKTRKHKMYAPLSIKDRNEILRKKQIWLDWWKVLVFVSALAFVLVTCNVIFVLWSSHYYTNNHIHNMIADSKFPTLNSITFHNVSNVTAFEQYLRNTFLNVIYNSRWYDRQLINDGNIKQYWTSDFTNKIVGRPKIRQLRSKTVICDGIVIPHGMCFPEWKERSEDTKIYSKGWNPGSFVDVHNKDSFWVYREKTFIFASWLQRFHGRSGRLFHDGGYSATLGPTKIEAEQTLDEMNVDRWQDDKTRVVFVEITTFNGNKILFSQATLIVEYFVSGLVLLQTRISSVSSIFDVNLWSCLFVVFIVSYLMRTIYLISYFGMFYYLLNGFDNLLQIIKIVTGISSIILFCAHLYTTSQYTNKLQELSYDEYFEYDSFIQFFVFLKISLTFLLCVSIIRVVGSIRGKILMYYVYTFFSSKSCIFWLIVLTILALFVLRQLTHILDITFFSAKELLVNSKSLKYVTAQHIQNYYMTIFILTKMFAIYLINTLFLVILIHNMRLSKSFVFSVSQEFNFIKFIISRIICWWNKVTSK